MPTIPPTVTTSGSAMLPVQNTLVDDDHDVVEHAAVPSRPDGVESVKAKLTPITERLLIDCEPATLDTDARELTVGASGVPVKNDVGEGTSSKKLCVTIKRKAVARCSDEAR